MNVLIKDLSNGLVSGVSVTLPEDGSTYHEAYFDWRASLLSASFKTSDISGGILKTWHHTPAFTQIETHVDREMFYFVSGTAIMLFMDVIDGKPDMDSAQIARICQGSQIIIEAGKGHFVPVAETDQPVTAVVVAPRMPAPRIDLPEPVIGI